VLLGTAGAARDAPISDDVVNGEQDVAARNSCHCAHEKPQREVIHSAVSHGFTGLSGEKFTATTFNWIPCACTDASIEGE
jgi:hypothetical protein